MLINPNPGRNFLLLISNRPPISKGSVKVLGGRSHRSMIDVSKSPRIACSSQISMIYLASCDEGHTRVISRESQSKCVEI